MRNVVVIEICKTEEFEIDVNENGKVVKKTRLSDGKIVKDKEEYKSDDANQVKANLLKNYKKENYKGR